MYQITFSEMEAKIGDISIKKEDAIGLEILPEKLSSGGGREVSVYKMLAVGEVSIPGRRKLRTWQINSVLEPDGERKVEFYRDLFIFLSNTEKPFCLTIIRKDADGGEAFGDQRYVILEDYDFEEKAGEIGTLYYKIKLKEYIRFELENKDIQGNEFVGITPSILDQEGGR